MQQDRVQNMPLQEYGGVEKYRFVPGLDKSYAGDIRAHVLRHHNVQRKARAKTRSRPAFQADHSSQLAGPSEIRQFSLSCNDLEDTQAKFDQAGTSGLVKAIDGNLPSKDRDVEKIEDVEEPNIPALMDMLGQGRVDPFQSFAAATTSRQNEFIDYYNSGHLHANFHAPEHMIFQPARDICFAVNIQYAPLIDVMCAFASRRMCLPAEATFWTLRAIRSVNRLISQSHTRYSDNTLWAVMGLICDSLELDLENRVPEHVAGARMHVQAIRQMIARQGGFLEVIKLKSWRITWLLHWVDILTHGEVSAGSAALSSHAFQPPSRLPPVLHRGFCPHTNDMMSLAEEFVGSYGDFFREARNRSIRYEIHDGHASSGEAGYIQAFQVFRSGSPYRRFMSDSKRGQPCGRVFCLLYLNIVLWDYRNEPPIVMHRYLQRLRSTMYKQGLDLAGASAIFMWVMTANPETNEVENWDRVLLLTRLVRIHVRLSERLQLQIEESLMDFILAGDENVHIPASESSLEEFRLDVMRELSVLLLAQKVLPI